VNLEQKVEETVRTAKNNICNILINLTYDIDTVVSEASQDLAQAESLLEEVALGYDIQLEEGLAKRILAFIHRKD